MDYVRKKAVVSGYPTELTIELTNRCNISCVFCPRSKMQRAQGFIDPRLFKHIVDQARGYIEGIDLDLMGESVLHPAICDMVNYCHCAGIKTILNSNMVAVDRSLSRELMKAGLDMFIMSIDGATKNTYESLRHGACFEQTKEHIEQALMHDHGRAYRVVQMVYTQDNKHEAAAFMRMWKHAGADYVRLKPYQNIDKQRLRLNPQQETVQDTVYQPCVQLWRKFGICWDGTAVLCCLDYDTFSVIGDVKKSTLQEIWNGERMIEYRKQQRAGELNKMPLCQECRMFKPGLVCLFGSVLVNPSAMRRVLFRLERLMIQKNIFFFRYGKNSI